jgi:hypothetical protein
MKKARGYVDRRGFGRRLGMNKLKRLTGITIVVATCSATATGWGEAPKGSGGVSKVAAK